MPSKPNAPKKSKAVKSIAPSPQLPDYLRPQLRLFLTADIVGSTSYKQSVVRSFNSDPTITSETKRKKDLHPKWFAPIADFYSQAQKHFSEEWESIRKRISQECSEDIGDPPSFWKAIGDEICFSKRLTSKLCLLAAMRAWISTLTHIRKMLKDHSPELDVKSAAWIAGFPVINTEVIFSNKSSAKSGAEDADDDYVYNVLALLKEFYSEKEKNATPGNVRSHLTRDFVGPSIDTGFRISSRATPRKMMLSVELAHIWAHVLKEVDHDGKPIHHHLCRIAFGYDGRSSLKGVMGGIPYPLFWVDLDTANPEKHELNQAEDLLLSHKEIKPKELLNFTDAFIDAHPEYLSEPYILVSDISKFGERPQKHIEQADRLRQIADWFEKESLKVAQENQMGDPKLLEQGNSLTKGKDSVIKFQ
jgi:hypothetical protein